MLKEDDGTVGSAGGSGQAVQSFCQTAGIELRGLIGKRAPLHVDNEERMSHLATRSAEAEIAMSEPPPPLDVREKESPGAGAGSVTEAT
jgi:hypothetical protein